MKRVVRDATGKSNVDVNFSVHSDTKMSVQILSLIQSLRCVREGCPPMALT